MYGLDFDVDNSVRCLSLRMAKKWPELDSDSYKNTYVSKVNANDPYFVDYWEARMKMKM